MKIFPERAHDLDETLIANFKPCRKKPITVQAQEIPYEFRVKTLEGDYKIGKAGDFLICGIDGEMYICDRDIFLRTYDWLEAEQQ